MRSSSGRHSSWWMTHGGVPSLLWTFVTFIGVPGGPSDKHASACKRLLQAGFPHTRGTREDGFGAQRGDLLQT
jgi:hypothetical protein